MSMSKFVTRTIWSRLLNPGQLGRRAFADHVHFNATAKKHPFRPLTAQEKYEIDVKEGDHTGRQQNHIWTPAEIEENMAHLYRHKPISFSDKLMNKLVSIS